MTRRIAPLPLFLLFAVLSSADPGRAEAQTIPIRTVPVASGDQFLILPSATLGMGGVRVAVDDSLADGWTNPAKGVLISESAFLGAPTAYSISQNGGGGRTFPVVGLLSGSGWFGGAALALQQIENGGGGGDVIFAEPAIDICCFNCCGGFQQTLSDRYGRNVYAAGYLGRTLARGWSVGIGGSAGQLGAMDGVDLLYAGSQRIDQSGSIGDVRLGLYNESDRDRLSLLLLHSRVSMKHEVAYSEWVWDEALSRGFTRSRVEVNEDQTRTWGVHGGWDRRLETPGWRVGVTGTLNYKNHPKIPNYSIQNIPRDPGTTWAYETAFGFSRSDERSTFGLDFVLQPIWSDTWQVANAQDAVDSGQRVSVGDRSIENDFFFTNVMIRSGLSQEVRGAHLQAGLEIRSYAYHLEQVDHVRNSYREQDEAWIEWVPSFGAVFHFDALDLRYAGRVITGTGRPGTGFDRFAPEAAADSPDFILAPDGPLTLQDVRILTHQLAVRIPIR